MVKIASVSRTPVEGRKVSKAAFRTRLHVTCNFEFPQELGRVAVAKRIRAILQANTEGLGLEPGTRFYFSKNAGDCGSGWGSGSGFILDRAAPGEPCTIFVTLEA